MYDTVLCIPYRNRQAHLDYFLLHSVPLLVKLLPNVHIVIIEQSEDKKLFNRGKLLNIAFKEYEHKTMYYITHDIDINPTEETISKHYSKTVGENEILGIYTSCYDTLGGIVKFQSLTIHTCNGFPNDYWGWGVEDKALQNRCVFHNMKISKNILNNDPLRGTYFKILNDIDDRTRSKDFDKRTDLEYTDFQKLHATAKKRMIQSSGINTLSYKILSTTEVDAHVTRLLVEL